MTMPGRICAATVSIAVFLSGVAFPGGAILCREGNGDVNIEPFHAPHASSCAPDQCDSAAGGAASVAHRHERCTDIEASRLQAPAKAKNILPGNELGLAVKDSFMDPVSVPGPAACAPSTASPPPSGNRTTILRI